MASPADNFRILAVMIREGRPINAITHCQQSFGLDLKEAKNLVEAIGEVMLYERARKEPWNV